MKNKNSIDKIFSEKFQNYNAKPRDLVWENLDRELSKKNGKTYEKYWALVTLFLVMIFGNGTLFFWNYSEEEKEVIKQEVKINTLLKVPKTVKNRQLEKTIKTVIIDKKESGIQTKKVHKMKKKAINLSTKGTKTKLKQNISKKNTKNKGDIATSQNSNTAVEAITNQNNSKIQKLENSEILEENIEKEEEIVVVLEEKKAKQASKKAGLHLTIRLGTQAGGRDEGREELEAEERANKANLLGKVLKSAWKFKKEKQLGKKIKKN